MLFVFSEGIILTHHYFGRLSPAISLEFRDKL